MMQARSSARLRSGRLAASALVSAAKHWSRGSAGPLADQAPNRRRGASAMRNERVDVDVLVIEDQRRVHRGGEVGQHFLVEFKIERADHGADPPQAEPQDKLLQALLGQQQHAALLRRRHGA